MRPTFEDITKRIKCLLKTFKVCVAGLLVTVTVSASNNSIVFFSPFFCFCTFALLYKLY